MDKVQFINHIKSFLPFNCTINIKGNKSKLICIKQRIFNTLIDIHPAFLNADKNIIQDIICFIINPNKLSSKESKKRISNYFQKNHIFKKARLNHKYKHKDIHFIFNDILKVLSRQFSDIKFDELHISWGKNYTRRTRSIRFGSFDKRNNLVRIHPCLDIEKIPDYFIKSIIYHEIAHYIIACYKLDNTPHNKDFKQLLKSIDPDYALSYKWEKENKGIFFKK